MRRLAAYRRSSGTFPWVADSTPLPARLNRASSCVRAKRMALTRYEEIAGTNHFTVIDPLANPGSPMAARVTALAYSVKSIAL